MAIRTIYPIDSAGVDFQRLQAAINGGAFSGGAMYDGGDKDTGVLVTSPAPALADGATLVVKSKKTTNEAATWKQGKLTQTKFATPADGPTKAYVLAALDAQGIRYPGDPLTGTPIPGDPNGALYPEIPGVSWVTAPMFFGFMPKPTGMEAFPFLGKSFLFKTGGNGGGEGEANYLSGSMVLNPAVFNLTPLYTDFSGLIGRITGYLYSPIAYSGYINYDTGMVIFSDGMNHFASGLCVSAAVGSRPIQTTKTNITITGDPLVDGVAQTVITGPIGNIAGALTYESPRCGTNCLFWLDGKANTPVTFQNIKFRRTTTAIGCGEGYAPPLATGAGGPIRIEHCAFEQMMQAFAAFVGKQYVYPSWSESRPYDHTPTPNSYSWVKDCVFDDTVYIGTFVGSEFTFENNQINPPDSLETQPTWAPSYMLLLGHVSGPDYIGGGYWDPNLDLCRSILVKNNEFNALHENGTPGTLLSGLVPLFGPTYDAVIMGGVVCLEAEGPGMTERVEVVDNEFTGYRCAETGILALLPGFGAEIQQVTYDGNQLSKIMGPSFFALPSSLHFLDQSYSGKYSDVVLTGNKLVDMLFQNAPIPRGPLGSGDWVTKPTMLIMGPGTGIGMASKVMFMKNDYVDSDRLPITSFDGDIGTSLILLDPTTQDCLVQESKMLPPGGDSLAFVTDLGVDNRVINHPVNKVKKPSGRDLELRQATVQPPLRMQDGRCGKPTTVHVVAVAAQP